LYDARIQSTLDFANSSSRIFIVAVPDDVLPEIVQEIELPSNAILVHTSGSRPLSILESAGARHIGVFYPLQTFSKKIKVDFTEIPVFVESDDSETERSLTTMAKAVSRKVFRISSEERRALHVAAVFASNFTNHMLTISKTILSGRNLEYEFLKPLITETINKSLSIGPEAAQTGPARRGDLEILDSHMEFLKEDEELSEIYRVISQHIVDHYDA
jgi:predicted short-subunit dehydrogenase-like oxidoreductase (DUF2520 family)